MDVVGASRVIDLSVTVASDLPSSWPTHMTCTVKMWNYYTPLTERQGHVPSVAPYQTRFWIIDEHTGTHFDAPAHFIPPPDSDLPWAGDWGLQTGDLVPLDDLIGPAAVVDVTDLNGLGADGESPWITCARIQEWEQEHGALSAGEVVLLHTGWDRYYRSGADGDAYATNPLVHRRGPGWPAPAPDLMRYLYDRGVRCVGIDAPSIGAAHDGAPAHRAGLSRGMRYVEMLTGLHLLPVRGAHFIFLPVKLAGSTGAPGRAVALVAEASDHASARSSEESRDASLRIRPDRHNADRT